MAKILLEIEVPDYLPDDASTELKYERAVELAEKAFSPDWLIESWHISDVQDVREDLTDDEARRVLKELKIGYDANIGINWEVIEIAIDNICEELS
jgi:hypothetical protein